ncbi:MAG: hypothetical protein FWD52_08090 [Candidatus Bathyarchaeota archaeon]|nr:hypothetical protein [Candidatus Termiticorpusculum sp.]
MLSSLIMLCIVSAPVQAISNLYVPQFSVKLVDNSYDLPSNTTTTVDSYTGKETTTTYPGYHIVDRKIEVTIKNQPFTPYTAVTNHTINLYYDIEVQNLVDDHLSSFERVQSNSEYTVERFSVNHLADDTQLLFRVKAKIGYWHDLNEGQVISSVYGIKDPRFFVQEQSDWSSVQTFTLPKVSLLAESPSQTTDLPTNQHTTPNSNQTILTDILSTSLLLGLIALLLCAIVVLVILFFRRQTKTFDINNNLPSQTNLHTKISSSTVV